MRKITLILLLAAMSLTAANATSLSKLREMARFISDRMAYELDMNAMQYDDCYEINFDFLVAVDPYMTYAVRGYENYIDRYYDCLDYRNDDMRMILTARQYRRFLDTEYFFRPICIYRNDWIIRVYQIYNNRSFFYFDRPTGYLTYNSIHSRKHHVNGYYANRYTHERHTTVVKIAGSPHRVNHGHSDFGMNRRSNDGHMQNGYNNRNQKQRTDDKRYIDTRKNKNTPEINKRNWRDR